MNIVDQKERYHSLVKEAEKIGNIDIGKNQSGMQRHPRFRVEDTEMEIDIRLKVSIIDISLSGVCFLSNIQFNPGQRFDFKVGAVFSIQANVVNCEMVETDADMMEVRYRVKSEFIEQELGLHRLLSIIDR